VLVVLAVLMMQSCQNNTQNQDESTPKNYNRNDAASYNTQLGLAYLKQGNRPRAKRKLLLALEQAPDSANVNASMAYYMEKTGEMDEARNFYQKAMSLAPGSGAQLNNYGTFLCRQGQYLEAENYFLQAVKDVQYEHTAGAYENAGLCAAAIPDFAKASRYFNKALEQDPSRKQSLYELVNISYKEKHTDEALAYLQKYPMLSLHDSSLLTLGEQVARQAGKTDMEEDYKRRLQQLNFSDNAGAKNEYNNNNG
jgi:type IV pilus assembly protein PilF